MAKKTSRENAKIIHSDNTTVFIVKEKMDYGISPFEVSLLFVEKGELNRITDHKKSEKEQNDYFNQIDEAFVKKALDDWREFYS